MKKISIYIFILVAGLMAISCVEPLTPNPVKGDGTYSLKMSVSCKDPETKATKPGVEDPYHENSLNWIDWFVFKDGVSEAVLHGRATGTDGVMDAFVVTLDNYVDASGISGTVHVIANLPTDQYKHDDEKGLLQSTDGGSTWSSTGFLTLDELGTLEVVASFGALNGGKFQAQTGFVMRGENTFELTPTAPVKTDFTVTLTRLAAKISLDLSVIPAFDEVITLPNGKATYSKTWYPNLEDIQIYLSFADNHGDLTGQPEDYADAAVNFFTYNRYAYKAAYSYTGNTGNPSATVPTTVTPEWDNSNWEWNVTGSPFYTYPIEWATSSPQAPFIKIILPWTAYDESKDENDNNALVYVDDVFVRAGRSKHAPVGGTATPREFYYKVPLPSETVDNNTKKLILNDNEWYELVLDVAILGGTSDDLPLELAGQYYVVDWSKPDFSAGGALKQGRYLSTASDTYYIYGGNSIKIPVQSSHDIGVAVTGVSFKDYSSEIATSYSGAAGLSHFPFTVTNPNRKVSATATGREEIELNHPLIDISKAGTGNNKPDVAEYTFTVLIYHKDLYSSTPSENSPNVKKITVIQQPTLSIVNDTNSDYRGPNYTDNQNNQHGGYVIVNGPSNTYQDVSHYGGANGLTGNNKNPNMYVITTSVAPSDYIIADPRSSSSSYLGGNNYNWTYNTNTGYYQTPHRLQYYYPTDTNRIAIAPKIRIASSYGVTSQLSSYQNAQRRCATYQEDGFPAGRWRVPTYAEVNFMISLTEYGVIPELFSDDTYYFCASGASGGCVRRESGDVKFYPNQTSGFVRCVYDEWYWGTEDRLTNRSTFTWGDKQIQ